MSARLYICWLLEICSSLQASGQLSGLCKRSEKVLFPHPSVAAICGIVHCRWSLEWTWGTNEDQFPTSVSAKRVEGIHVTNVLQQWSFLCATRVCYASKLLLVMSLLAKAITTGLCETVVLLGHKTFQHGRFCNILLLTSPTTFTTKKSRKKVLTQEWASVVEKQYEYMHYFHKKHV